MRGTKSINHVHSIVLHTGLYPGEDPGGGRLGPSSPQKPIKVISFTMIFFNSENSIRDVRPFCCALFCHSSVVKHTSSLLHLAKSLLDLTDYWIPPPKLNGWIRPCPHQSLSPHRLLQNCVGDVHPNLNKWFLNIVYCAWGFHHSTTLDSRTAG